MAKFLRMDPDFDYENNLLTGMNWRLPATTDLDELADQIKSALSAGEAVVVEVEMGDTPLQRSRVIINGALVHNVLISETPEPDA